MNTKIIIVIVIALLLGYSVYMTNELITVKKDRTRIETNFFNSQFHLDSIKTANGTLDYSVKTLELKKTELERFDADMTKTIEDQKIKIKNLESAKKIDIRYLVKTDSVQSKKTSDSTYITSFKDNWVNYSQKLLIKCKLNKITQVKADSLKIKISDELLILDEINYKGWWFWRKAVNITVHMKSSIDNPYMKIDQIQSYKLVK